MRRGAAAAAASATLLAGCTGGTGPDGPAGAPAPQPRTLAVYAETPLAGAFEELEPRFEEVNPGVDVVFAFGGAPDLAQRIADGAPADLFAAADAPAMRRVSDAGLVDGAPAVFATDVLQIATPRGNPAGVRSFADLSRPGLRLVGCVPQARCGSAAEELERATGAALDPVDEEPDARSALRRVATRAADAALVHTTDVHAAGDDVRGIDFPESALVVDEYAIAPIGDVDEADPARGFLNRVTGPEGGAVLRAAGFGTP